MLAIVSAVVAFDAWPGGNVASPAQTLILSDKAPPIRVSARSTAPSATTAARAATTAGRTLAAAGSPHRTLTSGAVGQPFTGGRTGNVTPVAAPALPAVPKAPNVPSTDTVIGSISNPSTAASQIADGTQTVTDAAGGSLTAVSPDAGTAVTQTGQAAAQTLRSIPLPGQVLPAG